MMRQAKPESQVFGPGSGSIWHMIRCRCGCHVAAGELRWVTKGESLSLTAPKQRALNLLPGLSL